MDTKITLRLVGVAVVALALFFHVALPIYNGHIKFMTVLSGSMSPFMHAGDVAIVSEIDASQVRVGDTITFQGQEKYISHKVIAIEKGKFRTKGIANEQADTQLREKKDVVGKVEFIIPKLGYLGNFMHTKWGYVFLILIPGILIIATEIKKIKQELEKGKSILIILFISTIVVCQAPLFNTTHAFFTDSESAEENTYTAGSLGISVGSNLLFNESLEKGETVTEEIQIRKTGSLDLRYRIRTREYEDNQVCENLQLKIGDEKDSLKEFEITQDMSGEKDEVEIEIRMGEGSGECEFSLLVESWQSNLGPSKGFTDEKELIGIIKSKEQKEIVINKIYWEENCKNQWIQIYSEEEMDIKDWEICNHETCRKITDHELEIEDHVILAHDKSLKNKWEIPRERIVPRLGGKLCLEDQDMLLLKNSHGNIVDQMNYGQVDEDWENHNEDLWERDGVKAKEILARNPIGKDTDTPEDWEQFDLPEVELIEPEKQNNSYIIRWKADNPNQGKLSIDLWYARGKNKWHEIILDTENDGEHVWEIPPGIHRYTGAGKYRIKLVASMQDHPLIQKQDQKAIIKKKTPSIM